MTKQQRKTRELIIEGGKNSVARALERHKKSGESVAGIPSPREPMGMHRALLRCWKQRASLAEN